MKASFVLPLLLLGAAGHGAIALAESPGTFSVTGSMTTPRAGHTATLLTNGKVLVAGGARETGFGGLILGTAELYDPSTGAFTAKKLDGGEVLAHLAFNVTGSSVPLFVISHLSGARLKPRASSSSPHKSPGHVC